jgi:membrane fusion protein, multidrug efflux system
MRTANVGWVLLVLLAGTLSCTSHEPAPETKTAMEPVAVHVETLRATPLASLYEAIGTVRAENSAQISSRIPSYIRQIHAAAGDRVSQGQLLVELDDRDLVSRLDQANAAKTEVEDAIQEAAQGLVAAQAQSDLAETTHKRFEELLAKKSVSQHEYDEVDTRLRAARAAMEMAQARKRQAEAKRTQVEAQIAGAEIALGYARIQAPFAGVVTARAMDPGTLATPGMPILVLDQAGRYRLEVSLAETRLSSVHPGQTVAVRFETLADPLEGRITEVVAAVDPSSRTALVKIALPAGSGLRSGMFGRAMLPGGGESALTVPDQAVVRHGQLQSVFVVEGDVARRRMVSLGSGANGRQTVLSGLSSGERVVLDPEKVRDGGPVRVSEAGQGAQS